MGRPEFSPEYWYLAFFSDGFKIWRGEKSEERGREKGRRRVRRGVGRGGEGEKGEEERRRRWWYILMVVEVEEYIHWHEPTKTAHLHTT